MRPVSRAPRYPSLKGLDRRALLKLGLGGATLLLLPRCEPPMSGDAMPPPDAGPGVLQSILLPPEGAFHAYHWDQALNQELAWSYALRFEADAEAADYCLAEEDRLRAQLISAVRFSRCGTPPAPEPVEEALREALREGLGRPTPIEAFELLMGHCGTAALAGEAPGW